MIEILNPPADLNPLNLINILINTLLAFNIYIISNDKSTIKSNVIYPEPYMVY